MNQSTVYRIDIAAFDEEGKAAESEHIYRKGLLCSTRFARSEAVVIDHPFRWID